MVCLQTILEIQARDLNAFWSLVFFFNFFNYVFNLHSRNDTCMWFYVIFNFVDGRIELFKWPVAMEKTFYFFEHIAQFGTKLVGDIWMNISNWAKRFILMVLVCHLVLSYYYPIPRNWNSINTERILFMSSILKKMYNCLNLGRNGWKGKSSFNKWNILIWFDSSFSILSFLRKNQISLNIVINWQNMACIIFLLFLIMNHFVLCIISLSFLHIGKWI